MQGTPLDALHKAKQEVADLKNDLKQMGKEFVDSAEQEITADKPADQLNKDS